MLNDIYINIDVQETKAFLNNVLFLNYILYCLMQKSNRLSYLSSASLFSHARLLLV